MSVFERISAGARAFVLGQGMVQPTPVYWFGPNDATDDTNDLGDYLRISNAVSVCVRRRAQSLSSVPLKAYRGAGDKRVDVTGGPLVELLSKVNPFWTFSRLIEMTEMSLGLWGEAFWFLERGASNRRPPQEIWWARSDRVRVVVSKSDYVSHFEYTPEGASEAIRYERDQVIWLHYPNPLNEWEGLSPLQAAMIAADTSRYAQVSNAAMFKNGMNLGGTVTPKGGTTLNEAQAKELEQGLARRFKGADKAHRWAVLRYEAEFKPLSISPKDAEFLGALNWGLEEIARAYGVPLDLIGGQRTYANVQEARLAFWMDTMLPEARFIANELTEQLLPMFPGQADVVAFDTDDVPVLAEAKASEWSRYKEMIAAGACTINEYRMERGDDPLPWGDEWWAPSTLVPIGMSGADMMAEKQAIADKIAASATVQDQPPPADPKALPPGDQQQSAAVKQTRAIAYGSPEHEQAWRMMVRRTEPHEQRFGEMVASLMRDQRQAVLARLKGRAARDVAETANDPFDMAPWIKKFREKARPQLEIIASDAGQAALVDLGLTLSFNIKDPNVIRFLEQRAQRFARQVNETTWEALKASLSQGIDAGESIPQLADRVEAVMGDRIRSSGETIARTEVIGASNGGTIEGYRQSGVVAGKEWLAALDERTRETHVAAHGQQVAIDADFQVGDGSGPAPGQIGLAEEDINCFTGDVTVYAESVKVTIERDYVGPIVTLRLDNGASLNVTPNHPLLTPRGFIAADKLNLGDDLVGYALKEDAVGTNPYPEYGPATFAEMSGLRPMAGQVQRIPGRHPQFHGDGSDGDVQVVTVNGELLNYSDATVGQPPGQNVLASSDVHAADMLGQRAGGKLAFGARPAPNGVVSSGSQTATLVRGSVGHAHEHGGATAAWLDARLQQAAADGRSPHTELVGEPLFGRAGKVALHKIVGIEIESGRHTVFNLQTASNYYLANGIISHNCRCTTVPILDTEWQGPQG